MTLATRTTNLRRRKAAQLEEARVNEIASVSEIGTDYSLTDRQGDLLVESKFRELYNLVDREEEKEAVARAFAIYQRSERNEERVVLGSVGESVELLRENNDLWLHDGCGPDDTGRAA